VYIGLDSGGDTAMLPDGGKIAKTQSAMVLEKLIGQFLFDKAATSGDSRRGASERSMSIRRAIHHAAALAVAASLLAGCATTPSRRRPVRADESARSTSSTTPSIRR
jgi:phospholipid/cholesterol/gamma-HCH transport system substrate-binding protein